MNKIKYYKTINYTFNLWKSDGTHWWYYRNLVIGSYYKKEWVRWDLPDHSPQYDGNYVGIDPELPREIPASEVFIKFL